MLRDKHLWRLPNVSGNLYNTRTYHMNIIWINARRIFKTCSSISQRFSVFDETRLLSQTKINETSGTALVFGHWPFERSFPIARNCELYCMQRSTIDQSVVLRQKNSGKLKRNKDGSIINVFDTNRKIGRELHCSVLVFQFWSSKSQKVDSVCEERTAAEYLIHTLCAWSPFYLLQVPKERASVAYNGFL